MLKTFLISNLTVSWGKKNNIFYGNLMRNTASATSQPKEDGELHPSHRFLGGTKPVGSSRLLWHHTRVAGAGWNNPRGWPTRLCVLQHFEAFLMLLRRNAISFSMINKLKIVDFAFHTFVFFAFIRDCSLFMIFLEV